MERLYAPWRTQYVTTDKTKKIEGCVFCHAVNTLDDDENLGILHRDEEFFIVMNKYPYSPGHFMIIPNIHTSNLEDLDPQTFAKMSFICPKRCKDVKRDTKCTRGKYRDEPW